MLKSEETLAQESGVELSRIRDRATALLVPLQPTTSSDKPTQNQGKKSKKKATLSDRSVANQLSQRYQGAKGVLECCAIAFLLQNGCKAPWQDEDPQKFIQRRRKVEIQYK